MKLDGVVIFDTGYITRATTACGLTLCEPGVDLLGDNPAATVILTGGTTPTGVTTALISGGSCDRLENIVVAAVPAASFIYGSLTNVITLPGDGEVSIELTRGTCTGPSPSPNASFAVKCV